MHTKAEDKEFIEHPERWPRWPNLPMKRPFFLDPPHHGLINADLPTWVWIVGPEQFAQMITTGKMYMTDHREYPSIDSLLDDGWVVD